jgi:hypothetical protein
MDVIFYTMRIILTNNNMAVGLYEDMGYRRHWSFYATTNTITKSDNFTLVILFLHYTLIYIVM